MPRRKLPGEPKMETCSFSMEKVKYEKFLRLCAEVPHVSGSSIIREHVMKKIDQLEKQQAERTEEKK